MKIWNHLSYECDRKNPTDDMKRAEKFFAENEERIQRIEKMLEDNASKYVFRQCIEYRVTHDWRMRPQYNRRDQYFPQDIVQLTPKEVFIDCGAYNGDTIESFLRFTHKKYKKIVAFEPDEKNVSAIRRKGERIFVIPSACWSSDTEVSFSMGEGSSSSVCNKTESNEKKIIRMRARAIDNVEECRDATFIKMDIEGSEYEALIGAQNTIKKNRPKLAICIYHSDEDMLRLIELIANWDLGYKFYIRHHAQKISETVLYAI